MKVAERSATLIVERNSQRDSGFRQVQVFVDEEHVGTLAVGQSLSVSLQPGSHSLRVYNTLVSKATEFDAGGDETVLYVTGNRASGCLLAIAASFGIGVMGVFLERKDAVPG